MDINNLDIFPAKFRYQGYFNIASIVRDAIKNVCKNVSLSMVILSIFLGIKDKIHNVNLSPSSGK